MDKRLVLIDRAGNYHIQGVIPGHITQAELRGIPQVTEGVCTLARVEKRYVLYRETEVTL